MWKGVTRLGVVSTIEAKCKDCYRCLRSCPVKAIRVVPGDNSGELHAQVVDSLCIACGTCVKECPQNAKRVRDEVSTAKALLRRYRNRVACSVAPSFVSGMQIERPLTLVTALKKLGFGVVEETAVGAALVARAHNAIVAHGSGAVISTACPVVVSFVERHLPDAICKMTPVVSPMIAHARSIRERYRISHVVFIGPCFAKKGEASESHKSDEVQSVLTFAELARWLEEEAIEPDKLEETCFDGPDAGVARFFPVEGGLAHTAALATGVTASEVISVSGVEDCIDFIETVVSGTAQLSGVRVVELLACRGGCVNGPGIAGKTDQFTRKARLVSYARSRAAQHERFQKAEQHDTPALGSQSLDLSRSLVAVRQDLAQPSEEQIIEILQRTGKLSPSDELNCGACGYDSCREKAIAVFRGLAEIEMCMPYMKLKAESMSNSVVDFSPDGILVVNSDGKIVQVNRAFERMFSCSSASVTGQPLETIIDPENYRKVLSEHEPVVVSVQYPKHGITTHQTIFYIPDQRLAVGMIADVTEEEQRKLAMLRLKTSTMARAQEVINKQMKVAQEIASLLGETTAETKVLLSKIIELNRQD